MHCTADLQIWGAAKKPHLLQIKTKVFLAKPYCFVEIGNWVYCCIEQILIDFVLIFGLDKHIGGNKAYRLQGRQFRNLNQFRISW